MDFCSIASGSSGNCIFVGTDHTGVLVDAGISGKRVVAGLNFIDRKPEELKGIFITHEHLDHISSLGVLARKFGIPIYCTRGTRQAILTQNKVGKVDEMLFHEILPDHPIMIDDLTINPFRVSHDAAEPVAYRLSCGKKSVAVATDLGFYDDYIIRNLQGLDAILIESNHDKNMLQVGIYPYYLKQRILGKRGHLSNETAGQLLCEILHDDIKKVLLGHISKENNYEALALATVCAEITMGENPYRAEDFQIQTARRDEPSQLIAI